MRLKEGESNRPVSGPVAEKSFAMTRNPFPVAIMMAGDPVLVAPMGSNPLPMFVVVAVNPDLAALSLGHTAIEGNAAGHE